MFISEVRVVARQLVVEVIYVITTRSQGSPVQSVMVLHVEVLVFQLISGISLMVGFVVQQG